MNLKIENRALVLLFFLVLCPLILLSFYTYPVGVHDWDWLVFFEYEELSFIQFQTLMYEKYTGRFASTLLLSTSPYWINLFTYKLIPIILLLSMTASLYILFRQLFRYFNNTGINTWVPTLAFIVILIQGLSGIYEFLYIISSSFTYTVAFILLNFWLALFIVLHQRFSIFPFFTLLLITIALNGWNELYLLFINLMLVHFIGWKIWNKKKVPAWIWITLIISLLSGLTEALAPANFIRINAYPGSGDILKTLFLTVAALGSNLISWIANTTLGLMTIALLPVLGQIAKIIPQKTLNRKSILTFISLSLSWQIVPLLLLFYSCGPNSMPERVVDTLYILFLSSFFGGVLIFIKKYKLFDFKIKNSLLKTGLWVFIGTIILFNPIKIKRDIPPPTSLQPKELFQFLDVRNNTGTAWLTLLDGSAKEYATFNQNLFEEIKNCTSDTLWVEPPAFPKIIYEPIFDRKHKAGNNRISIYFENKIDRIIYKKETK